MAMAKAGPKLKHMSKRMDFPVKMALAHQEVVAPVEVDFLSWFLASCYHCLFEVDDFLGLGRRAATFRD